MVRRSLLASSLFVLGTLHCGQPGGGGGGGDGDDPGAQPQSSYDSPADLTRAAPPVWEPSGIEEEIGGVSFLRSPDWEKTTYDGALRVLSPADAYGNKCEMFVFEPRAAAKTEQARREQALEVASEVVLLEGETFTNQYGSASLEDYSFHGSTGTGWDYSGLRLSIHYGRAEQHDVLAMIARFGDSAVPFLVGEPKGSEWGCVEHGGHFGLEVARIFFSLSLGDPSVDDSLASNVIGEWFSSGGSAGNRYVFGANAQYIHASVARGVEELTPGDWRDRYATWSGDGSWAAVGDLLALFPNDGAATSHYARHFESLELDGTWEPQLCWIDSFEGEPYTYCTRPSE